MPRAQFLKFLFKKAASVPGFCSADPWAHARYPGGPGEFYSHECECSMPSIVGREENLPLCSPLSLVMESTVINSLKCQDPKERGYRNRAQVLGGSF